VLLFAVMACSVLSRGTVKTTLRKHTPRSSPEDPSDVKESKKLFSFKRKYKLTPLESPSSPHAASLIVMSGDSTMRAQAVHLYSKFKQNIPNTVINFLPIAGGHAPHPRSLPSVYSTCTHVSDLLSRHLKSGRPVSKVVVYVNFGLLHLLHVHPHRPWELRNSTRLAAKAYHYADFQGFFNLENWIASEVECLSGLAEVALILIQTPHHMCDASISGIYRSALASTNIGDTVSECASHLSELTALSSSQAHSLCADGVFTGENTAKLAARMRGVSKRYACSVTGEKGSGARGAAAVPPVCVIDSHRMTAALPNCSEATQDGRHYDENVLLDEVAELKGYLSRLNIWTDLI